MDRLRNRCRQAVSVLLAGLVLCLLALSVQAGDRPLSGSCGEQLLWQFDPESGALTITGTGAMEDYEHPVFAVFAPAPWRDVRHQIRSVSLPEGLTAIGAYAFADCSRLSGLTIPSTVEKLGMGALLDCLALSQIHVTEGNPAYHSADGVLYDSPSATLLLCPPQKTGHCAIPEGTLAIAADAFLFCQVDTVALPASLTVISDDRPFYYCRQLRAFSVAEGNPAFSAPDGVLFDHTGARLLRYPAGRQGDYALAEGVTAIADHALEGCAGLTGLTLPDSLLTMGDQSAADCPALTRVTFGAGLTELGENAFAQNIALDSVTLPASLTRCGAGAFGCCTALTNIQTEPSSAACVAFDGVLFSADGTLLAYPAGRTGDYAIPGGTTALEARSFWGAGGLTAITIPASVSRIGDSAFSGCGMLTDVYYGGSPEDWQRLDKGFGNEALELATLHCGWGQPITGTCGDGVTWSLDLSDGTLTLSGSGPMEDFAPGALPWGDHAHQIKRLVVQPGVTAIGSHAFAGCAALTQASLPQGLLTVGEQAFFACGLTAIHLPASLTAAGHAAFSDCRDLRAITVAGENPQFSAAEGVLYDKAMTRLIQCPAGKTGEFLVPHGVAALEDTAFFNTALTALQLPATLEAIGAGALDGDRSALTAITVAPGNPRYHDADGVLLEGTTLLRYPAAREGAVYAAPPGVEVIASRAFGNSLHLEQVLLPAGVTRLEERAFEGCYALTDAVLGTELAAIGQGAFYGCWRLERLTLPATLQTVEQDAFLGCDSLLRVDHGGTAAQWAALAPAPGNQRLTDAPRRQVYLGALGGRIFQRAAGSQTLTFLLPQAYPPEETVLLAGYDNAGRLCALRFLPADGSLPLPEAAAIRLFLVDEHFCPLCDFAAIS